jgi:hypothetical protein
MHRSTGLLGLLLLALGCALLPQGERAEPGIIVIRNRSGHDVETVTLVNATATRGQAIRHGSISPVPQGVSQVVVRPTNPPPLAQAIDVTWNDSSGESFTVHVDLDEALAGQVGGPDLALVLELRSQGELSSYTEHRPR